MGLLPIFIKILQPVPSVALAVPASKQPSPKAAACESPIKAVIGTGPGKRLLSVVSPNKDEDAFSSGRLSSANPNWLINSSSHSNVCRLKNNVLDAFV